MFYFVKMWWLLPSAVQRLLAGFAKPRRVPMRPQQPLSTHVAPSTANIFSTALILWLLMCVHIVPYSSYWLARSDSVSGRSVLSCRRQGDPLLFIWTLWLHLVRCDWSGTSGEKAPDKWAWLDSANQLSTLVFMRQVEWAGSLPSYLPITWVKISQETFQIYCRIQKRAVFFLSWRFLNILSWLCLL